MFRQWNLLKAYEDVKRSHPKQPQKVLDWVKNLYEFDNMSRGGGWRLWWLFAAPPSYYRTRRARIPIGLADANQQERQLKEYARYLNKKPKGTDIREHADFLMFALLRTRFPRRPPDGGERVNQNGTPIADQEEMKMAA